MTNELVADLAPTGTLRAAINMANFLLVTGRSATGDPQGVAPDMARAVAEKLGVSVSYVPFEKPSELAAAATAGVWDIGLIGAEPARAETIAFTAAYCEIQATYLLPADSALKEMADVDQPGVRISVNGGSAYDLWLTRHIKHAELVRAPSIDASYDRFVDEGLDALAGLRPRLLADVEKLPDARVLDGQFTAIQQAIGTPRSNGPAVVAFLETFVDDAKRSGFVAELIERHRVRGLSVAAARS